MEVLKERSTVQELAQKYEVRVQQIYQWKRAFLSNVETVFDKGAKSAKSAAEEKEERLLKVIGQQKVELDFFKERLAIKPLNKRRLMISKDHSNLSIVKQYKLLKLHRSGVYYKAKGESALNLELMQLIDTHYMDHCFKGAKRMHTWLALDKGYKVNLKRIKRLYYKVMGLRAVMPGKHTSRRNKAHKVYPYLLKNLSVESANQVWATDITYIPMRKGFMYLVAIIDLYSRYVLNVSLRVRTYCKNKKDSFGSPFLVFGICV